MIDQGIFGMLIENPLNSFVWSFPILECLHIIGFAMAIGSVAIVDFRLLGLGLLDTTPSQLGRRQAEATQRSTIC